MIRSRSPAPLPSAGIPPGWTLIHIAIGLAFASICAALVVPPAHRWLRTNRSEATIHDLRRFAAAFRTFAREHGEWPKNGTAPGAYPPGMKQFLVHEDWTGQSPIGGRYKWDRHTLHRGYRYEAAISIRSVKGSPVSNDLLQLYDIDRRIDDGNLATGNFVLGYRNSPVFVLEP